MIIFFPLLLLIASIVVNFVLMIVYSFMDGYGDKAKKHLKYFLITLLILIVLIIIGVSYCFNNLSIGVH